VFACKFFEDARSENAGIKIYDAGVVLMKAYLPRIIVLIVTFIVGIYFVRDDSIIKSSSECNSATTLETKSLSSVSQDEPVKIRFKEYGELESRLTLKFEIVNQTSESIFFSSPGNIPFTYVKFNGKEDYEWRCGTGATDKEIKSGENFVIELQADTFFYRHLNQSGNFQVGFSLEVGRSRYARIGDKYEKYWSENFQIPDEIRKVIIKNAPEWVKSGGFE
jgi:hypothetical protein